MTLTVRNRLVAVIAGAMNFRPYQFFYPFLLGKKNIKDIKEPEPNKQEGFNHFLLQ